MRKIWHNILAVSKREMERIAARPLYLVSTVLVMVVTVVFYTTLMSSGAPENMPIAVIDNDGSSISRRLTHELQATPSVNIVAIVPSYTEAREMVQEGKIYGFLEIPDYFYSDLVAQRQPKLHFYVSYAYTMAGTTTYKQLLTLTNLVNGAFLQQILKLKGTSEYQLMDIVQPVVIDGHMLFNPWGNYPTYLLTTLFPGTLGVIVLMVVIFSIGFELKMSTTHEWLRTAGDNYHVAIIGKMLPFTVIFILLGTGFMAIFYGFLGFPINGHWFLLVLSLLLFIIAMECFGIILIGLLPVLRDALSAGALLGMMSFTLSGFTFPNMGMLPFVRSIAYLFPLRHYYLFYVQEALLDTEFSTACWSLVALLAYIPCAYLVSWRLKNAMYFLHYPKK